MPLTSTERFRSALRAARAVVWDLDLQTGFAVRSGSSLDILGIPSGAGEDFARLVHPEDRPSVDAALEAAYADKGSYDVEFRVTRPDGQLCWVHEVAEVHRDVAGQPVRLCGVSVDITERKAAEEELRASQEQIAADLDAITHLYEVGSHCARPASEFDRCLDMILDAAISVTGADKGNIQLLEPGSSSLVIAVQRGFAQPFLDFFAHVRDENSACGGAMLSAERMLVEDVMRSDLFAGRASLDVLLAAGVRAVQSTPLVSSTGSVLGVISTHFGRPVRLSERNLRLMDLLARQAADYLERKLGEEHQQLLTRELDHRAKNMLAVVLSILRLTRPDEPELFVSNITGRVMALARAHSLLADSRWQGADLGRLLADELAPYLAHKGHIAVSGPSAMLQPAASQSLALAIHELATNAAKHGALCRPTGRLAVKWQVGDDGLTLSWTETGGPIVSAVPARRGFGSTVILASVKHQLKGRVTLDWHPEGLRATVWVPIMQLCNIDSAVPADRSPIPARAPHGLAQTATSVGKRILVVEDEPLVALAIQSALADAGYSVVGPAVSLDQALDVVNGQTLDAAILDRNLAGVSSEPVARWLRERGIPYAVVTGYPEDDLPPDLAVAPHLGKPFDPDALAALVRRLVA